MLAPVYATRQTPRVVCVRNCNVAMSQRQAAIPARNDWSRKTCQFAIAKDLRLILSVQTRSSPNFRTAYFVLTPSYYPDRISLQHLPVHSLSTSTPLSAPLPLSILILHPLLKQSIPLLLPLLLRHIRNPPLRPSQRSLLNLPPALAIILKALLCSRFARVLGRAVYFCA